MQLVSSPESLNERMQRSVSLVLYHLLMLKFTKFIIENLVTRIVHNHGLWWNNVWLSGKSAQKSRENFQRNLGEISEKFSAEICACGNHKRESFSQLRITDNSQRLLFLHKSL